VKNMSRARPIASRARRISTVIAAAAATSLGLLGVAAPSASAKADVGWVQLAHLSPNTPDVDVYLYSFGDATAQLVLHHVGYGDVSPFVQVRTGDYTVAMRLAGAPVKSKPVLSTAVDVQAGHAYTVAGMGPAKGLRLQIIPDQLTAPAGKSLVRVIQASLQEDSVTVTAGSRHLATNLKFASVTGYHAVSPGTIAVHASGGSESASSSVDLAAGTIHTLVILDNVGTLRIDDLLEAAGSQAATGGVQTGLGGTAAQPGAPLRPWIAVTLAGLLTAAGGVLLLSRRRRPALHARRHAGSA
jgi:Domain of unknown function (DUF4397)